MKAFPNTARLSWTVSALLGAAVWVVFYPALAAEFVHWDDDLNIYANPHILGLDPANLRWMFTDLAYARRYMPLAWLNWAMNFQVAGLSPLSCHLGNLLFHSLNAVLVFLLIRRLLALAHPRHAGRESSCVVYSALGALLWAVHPLRVEAVAWASARIYQQALLFALLSVLAYLRFVAAPPTAPARRVFYWASVACLGASLATYPIMLCVGFVPLILDFYPLRRLTRGETGWGHAANRRVLLEKAPFLAAIGLTLGVTVWARIHFAGIFEPPVSLRQFGFVPRLMQAFYIWSYYLWKPWAPFDLAPVYTTLVWFNPADWPFLLSLVLVISITILLIWKRRQWPAVWTVWICYLVLLVPVLGLTEHPHYASDRYSYLAAILWSIVISAGLLHLADHPKVQVSALTACVVVAALWGTLSVRQTRVWHDSVSLFSYLLAKLGDHRYRGDIHWRLGKVLAEQGRWDNAISHYSAALEALPLFPDAHESWAAALESQNKSEEALAHYESAVRMRPTAERHIKLALALGRQGQNAAAARHYREGLRRTPDLPGALNNLAWILATDGEANTRNGREAVALAERACELTRYQKAQFVGTLAAAYAEAGRFADAVKTAEKAGALAAASGESEVAATNAQLVQLYRQGKPYHAEPRPLN